MSEELAYALWIGGSVGLYSLWCLIDFAREWWHGGIKPTYCQGCDELQPTACMRFTEIGLYRCDACRRDPKLLDTAKAIEQSVRDKQFTPIHGGIPWECQCGARAKYYEWNTGIRYCFKHMKAQPLYITGCEVGPN